MASAANPIQRQAPSKKDRKHQDSFYDEPTVVTRRPPILAIAGKGFPSVSGKKINIFAALIRDEAPMPTPKKEISADEKYVLDLGRRIEKDEQVKKLPDLTKEVKEVA